ncbi:MAG TPA: hypothetical protein VMF30_13245 [Pirellulales bacterium]|nr:hypothetical protein [Pirellulales bacterium]
MANSDGLACRLLVDPPASGAWNMAVDEALVEDAAERGTCWLRFYRWGEPTLSLGYFQGHAERLGHRASRQCPLVRRVSGGGAILHDAEVTYCLAIPHAHPLAEDTSWLYTAVHEGLVETLYAFGIEGERLTTAPPAGGREAEPFLCFLRRAVGDVVSGSAKICGSAQRRRRGAILQHGSFILHRSEYAPEIAGLADLTGAKIDEAKLIGGWTEAIGRRLKLAIAPGPMDERLMDAVRTLTLEKFSAESWTCRR